MIHREPLEWPEYDRDVEKFKMEHIVPDIADEELSDRTYPLVWSPDLLNFITHNCLNFPTSMEEFIDHSLKAHSFAANPNSTKLIQLGDFDLDELESDTTVEIQVRDGLKNIG